MWNNHESLSISVSDQSLSFLNKIIDVLLFVSSFHLRMKPMGMCSVVCREEICHNEILMWAISSFTGQNHV